MIVREKKKHTKYQCVCADACDDDLQHCMATATNIQWLWFCTVTVSTLQCWFIHRAVFSSSSLFTSLFFSRHTGESIKPHTHFYFLFIALLLFFHCTFWFLSLSAPLYLSCSHNSNIYASQMNIHYNFIIVWLHFSIVIACITYK